MANRISCIEKGLINQGTLVLKRDSPDFLDYVLIISAEVSSNTEQHICRKQLNSDISCSIGHSQQFYGWGWKKREKITNN